MAIELNHTIVPARDPKAMAGPDQLLDNLRAAGKDWYAAPAGSGEERAAACTSQRH